MIPPHGSRTKNEYKNDKKVGTHQLYSKDFKLTAVENYDAFGNPNGIWTKYRYDGKTSSIKEYLPNGSINYTTFDTNEVLNSITVYEPNNLRSYVTKRYELGNILSEEIIKNNKKLFSLSRHLQICFSTLQGSPGLISV